MSSKLSSFPYQVAQSKTVQDLLIQYVSVFIHAFGLHLLIFPGIYKTYAESLYTAVMGMFVTTAVVMNVLNKPRFYRVAHEHIDHDERISISAVLAKTVIVVIIALVFLAVARPALNSTYMKLLILLSAGMYLQDMLYQEIRLRNLVIGTALITIGPVTFYFILHFVFAPYDSFILCFYMSVLAGVVILILDRAKFIVLDRDRDRSLDMSWTVMSAAKILDKYIDRVIVAWFAPVSFAAPYLALASISGIVNMPVAVANRVLISRKIDIIKKAHVLLKLRKAATIFLVVSLPLGMIATIIVSGLVYGLKMQDYALIIVFLIVFYRFGVMVENSVFALGFRVIKRDLVKVSYAIVIGGLVLFISAMVEFSVIYVGILGLVIWVCLYYEQRQLFEFIRSHNTTDSGQVLSEAGEVL